MAESFIYDLCKAVGSKVLEEGRLLHGVRQEAAKMKKKLERIEGVLREAEKREMEADVKEWIRELKDVAYDIEDVLDDWSIAQLQMQDQFGTSSQHGNNNNEPEVDQVCFTCIPTPSSCLKQTKLRHDIASAIKNINSRLDEIYEGKKKFKFPKSDTSSINEVSLREITTSFKESIVVGSQDNAKAVLMEKLVHGDVKNIIVAGVNHIPIISIVGMGGIGKTTLARLVYNDDTVREHFSKVIWVCVSNTCNEMYVARAIAEGLDLNVKSDSTMQYVLSKIDDSIQGCKFLLVLDDVWEESERKWSVILKCLAKGDAQVSRILMTTRSSEFSQKMRAVFKYSVNLLSDADAWSLFSYYAFSEDSNHRERVEGIAEQLFKKCKGLPLALEVLGRHMYTKTSRSEWQAALDSEIWETQFEDEVFKSLAFSYLELRSEAKRCFAFCSVFPKDTVMSKNILICLWMAQGYLQGSRTREMEDLGEECFNSLVRRSFLQVDRESDGTYVTMHDIVHDFARSTCSGEIAILDPSFQMTEGGQTNTKPRHLILNANELHRPSLSFDLKALRSLFLINYPKSFLNDFFPNKSYIRVLVMDDTENIGDVDLKGIGKLVHLRFVCLISSHLTVLPKEICGLPYLLTLDVDHCDKLKSLPNEIGSLTCLRHLFINDYTYMNRLPKGLGKLSSLQTLKYFPCSSLDRRDCSSLEDLRDLNNLRGHLWLKNLNQVAHVSEAAAAQLRMKKHIRQLTLEFGNGDPSVQSDVLEALEPAKENYIELLQIEEYRGGRCALWIGELRNLKEVVLMDVGTEVLPAGLGMLRYLEILYIKGAYGVKHVGEEFLGISEPNTGFFPQLTKLEFRDMPQWEQWKSPKVTGTVMPFLRRLEVTGCGALQSLPCFLEQVHLESLMVDSPHLSQVELVEDEDCPGKWRMGDVLLPQTLKNIVTTSTELVQKETSDRHKDTALEVVQQQHDIYFNYLHIMRMPRVPGWIMALTCLKHIELDYIEDECLPPLGSMRCLEQLYIFGAEKVEKVGDEFLGISNTDDNNREGGRASAAFTAFPRLKQLTFQNLFAWREWEDPRNCRNSNNQMVIMPYLFDLNIFECNRLNSLPQFFECVPLKKMHLGSIYVKKTDMLKIRNTRKDESICQMVKEGSSTILPQQPDFSDVELDGVRNEWLCDWAKYCIRLTRLTLSRCSEASFVGLEVLPSLEKLGLWYCDDLIRMAKQVSRISSLKELHLDTMSRLEEWEEDPPLRLEDESRHHDITNSGILSNLRILSLFSCPRLKALPSFLMTTPLERLHISNCTALETWWANEAGQHWRNWTSSIPIFTFTDKYGSPVKVT